MQDQSPTVLGATVLASSTAGFGSVFVAVASPYIKSGGCLALVVGFRQWYW